MPSERIAKCFQDIVDAIALIETWVADAGGAENAIYRDVKTRNAIERQILIVSEAAVRLNKLDPSIGSRLAPDVDWPGIRGIGNFIRHKYDDLDRSILVNAINTRLADLRQACLTAIQRLNAD